MGSSDRQKGREDPDKERLKGKAVRVSGGSASPISVDTPQSNQINIYICILYIVIYNIFT